MISQPTLIIMAKAPEHGKQRLAAEIGAEAALEVNRALHKLTMREACDPLWRTLLYVTPDDAAQNARDVWPREIARLAQGEGDLGERLARALSRHDNVAVIGTDCPLLSRTHIEAAFDALAQTRFALGPTEDGGFWVLAARSGAEAALAMANVRWSSANAARDVLGNLGEEVVLLPTLYDIDTAADLRRWKINAPR